MFASMIKSGVKCTEKELKHWCIVIRLFLCRDCVSAGNAGLRAFLPRMVQEKTADCHFLSN